jgi:small subunit ribosomal protein S6
VNDYEVMVIVHPEVDEEGVTAFNEQIANFVSSQGGEVVKTDVWGRRKLAYAIAKQSEGTYVVLQMQLDGSHLAELDRNLKLNEQVIRHMVLRRDH